MIPCRTARTRATAVLVFLLALCSFGWAQSGRGSVSGTVHDSSGASVPGAKVTLISSATNERYDLTTNDAGDYTAADVPVGTYSVRVEKPGFSQSEINGLTVNAAATVRADVTMQIGQARQMIQVQASALQINSEDARTSVTVNQTLVNELPAAVVAGTVRSPFDLASLTPEAKNTGSAEGFALGGGQADSCRATLDGVSINTSRALQKNWVTSNAPSVEAITQFTVDTNGFKAEYGHAGQAARCCSWRNRERTTFTGRRMSLSATPISTRTIGSAIAPGRPARSTSRTISVSRRAVRFIFRRFTTGEIRPSSSSHTRGFRNRNGATNATATVPTPEMYNGDFSKWVNSNGAVIPIYNPTTRVQNANGSYARAVFPGNQIPATMFNATAIQALKVFQASGVLGPNNGAAPGTPAYVNNNYIISNGTNVQPVNKWSIKGDHLFNEKQRISGYYGYDREATTAGPDGPATLAGTVLELQRSAPELRRAAVQLGLDTESGEIQSLLCGR